MIKKLTQKYGMPLLFLFLLGAGYTYMNTLHIPSSAIEIIRAPYAHEQNLTGKGVSIAVIDEGFDKNHSLIQNNLSHLRYNGDHNNWDVSESVRYENGHYKFASHGTHVTGIIAGENRKIGVAPKATVVPIKMGVWGGDQAIVKTLEYAQKSPASIVNISMQLSHSANHLSHNVQEALVELADSGKIIVIAAGNSGIPMNYSGYTRDLMKVAHDPRVQGRMVIVGATSYKNLTESLAEFSNFPASGTSYFSPNYFVTAPGNEITSAVFGGKTDKMSGTSMATPMVTGSLALLKQSFPELSPQELVALLLTSARQHGLGTQQALSQNRFGHGVVDVKAALHLGNQLFRKNNISL